MELKLLKFRKEKAKQKIKEDLKAGIGSYFSSAVKSLKFGMKNEVSTNNTSIELNENPQSETKPFNYVKLSLWFFLWILAFIFFIYVQFGAVYFCVTALCFIYYNTRTDKKSKNEISAYSVFNDNCEAIEGTFTAEQFDKQVRSGMF